jgi:hypothetical protein
MRDDSERERATEAWKERGAGPPPPTDPRWWCRVHRRPLTWRETHADPPGCSWCQGGATEGRLL